MFARFLRSKIGEERFQAVMKHLVSLENPTENIESEQGQARILEIIGEQNADCLKILKFLIGGGSSNNNSMIPTPNG